MKRVLSLAFGLTASLAAVYGQKLDPIQWTLTSQVTKAPPASTVPLHLKATFQEGWHLYSLTTPAGGPIPTTAALAENPAVTQSKFYQPPPVRQFDKNFNLDTETFEKEVDLPLTAELTPDAKGAVELTANVRYQACSDRQCLPPRKKTASFIVMVDPAAAAPAAFVVPAGYTEIKPGAVAAKVVNASASAPNSGADRLTRLTPVASPRFS